MPRCRCRCTPWHRNVVKFAYVPASLPRCPPIFYVTIFHHLPTLPLPPHPSPPFPPPYLPPPSLSPALPSSPSLRKTSPVTHHPVVVIVHRFPHPPPTLAFTTRSAPPPLLTVAIGGSERTPNPIRLAPSQHRTASTWHLHRARPCAPCDALSRRHR